MEELIARLEPRMRARFREVMRTVRRRRTVAELEAALEDGSIGTVLDDVEAAAGKVAAESAAAHATVAAEVLTHVQGKVEQLLSYDGTNPRVVAALQRSRYDMIQGLREDQRQAIGEALRLGAAEGWNPRQTAIAIRDSIGLTADQTRWVANYRRALETADRRALAYKLRDARSDSAVRAAVESGKPLAQDRIDRLVARYSERQLKLRAETIARTETIRAAHEAQDEAYEQVIESGLDVDRLQAQWHAGAKPRTRDSHVTMNGQLRRHGGGPVCDDDPVPLVAMHLRGRRTGLLHGDGRPGLDRAAHKALHVVRQAGDAMRVDAPQARLHQAVRQLPGISRRHAELFQAAARPGGDGFMRDRHAAFDDGLAHGWSVIPFAWDSRDRNTVPLPAGSIGDHPRGRQSAGVNSETGGTAGW